MKRRFNLIKYYGLSIIFLINFVIATLVLIIPGRHFRDDSNEFFPSRQLKAFILSAYYYPKSKSLGNNSLALVMSINLGRKKKDYKDLYIGDSIDKSEIKVMARNKSMSIVVSTHYERITLHDNCQMITIFATMQLLPNVTRIAMVSNKRLTDIPYKIPSYSKRDVVVCISPLYVSEQWQNFLLAAHVYKHFGAHLHVYFISAVSSFFQLVHEYETSGYITMQPWDRVMFPFVPGATADPYQEIEFLSLAGAQTDCILQYKESAKFVALFDLNDILVPGLAPTYIEEFQILMANQTQVAFLTYPRRSFEGIVFNNTKFSIQTMMHSLMDKNTIKTGKTVINPQKLNYTWMDRPLFIPDGSYSLDVTENSIIHFENITWINESPEEVTKNNTKIFAGTMLNDTAISRIEADFQLMSKKENIADIFPALPKFYYFYYLVKNCFGEKYYQLLRSESTSWVKNLCPGPQMCGFYQHPDILCVHVNATHIFMEAVEPITYYYATDHHYTSDIGCYAH